MPPLQPDQVSFLLHLTLASIRNEHSLTRRVIEAIPLDKGDYRPDSVSKSALELAWHIVATEQRFFEAVTAGEFNFAPNPLPQSIKNSADLVAAYEEIFAEKTAPLTQLSSEQLSKIVDFRGMFQLPAVMYLQFVLSHTIHHRGQLTMYLRPMGAKVPAIYGESYDSAKAKTA